MSSLHITGEVADDAPGARVGGRPLAPAGTPWPRCRTCTGPLRFIAQVPHDDRLLLAFQCENDPGSCSEWEPAGGGNAALIVRGEVPLDPPPYTAPSGVAATFSPAHGLHTADGDDGVGRLGGEPDWIQSDETPTCCGAPMRFALQLSESAHRRHLNFCGGGAAYVFACSTCSAAAFLMQQ